MAFRPIVLWPDPDLKKKSEPVTVFDEELKSLIKDLWDTMYESKGAGLAAPQVAVHKRVLVVDVSYADKDAKPIALVNPTVTRVSPERVLFDEACLSIPNQSEHVSRHSEIVVEYQTETGEKQTIVATGMLAVALQHEMDHLDGVLYPDRVSSLKRGILRKKAEKLKRGIELMQKRRDAEVARLKSMGLSVTPAGRVTLDPNKAV